MVLLDVGGFWGPLVTQLDRMVSTGLLGLASRSRIQRAVTAQQALDALAAAEPPPPQEWIAAEER